MSPTHRSRQFRFAALGIILLTVAIRLPSLLHPQPIDDEAGYSVIANEIVDGGRPYIDAVDRKPPLLFWTYAAVFKVAGEYNWLALHMLSLIWTLATMAGLYVIAKQLFDRETGLIAALFYSVFQPWVSFKNLAFNGEMVMNLAIVWAWAIALRHSSSRLRPELFLAGVLLCAGFLLKQPAAIAAVPLGIYLLLPSYRASRSLTRTDSIIQAAMLTAGFFAALGLVTIVLWRQGILHEAFYWTIADHDVPHVFWGTGIKNTLIFLGTCLPLAIGAIMTCLHKSEIWAGRTAERIALFGLLAASVIGAAAGARFYEHYYIQLIPPLALLAAPYYAQLWTRRMQPPHWLLRPSLTYAWLALTIVAFSISHWLALATRREPKETGRYLLEHSLQTTGFSSGAIKREFISRHDDVLLVAISCRFHSRDQCSADRSRVLILAAGSCQAPGPTSSRILPGIRRPTLSIFTLSLAHYIQCKTFRFWPNFWRNDTSRWRGLLRV